MRNYIQAGKKQHYRLSGWRETNIHAGEKLHYRLSGWRETIIQAGEKLHYRLVRKYILAVRLVRNYIKAGEELYKGW